MEVIRPGTRVVLGGGDDVFEATVSSVDIGMNLRILYRCSWWSGREFKDVWIDGPLVRTKELRPDLMRVGFATPE